ncbi:MFS transporter [Luteipulveratus mongoliensis]|uniref:Major facilitator superfamily (MFS) profile domain-containing protein n=1 Tax=Luteipulveratus mongoliensis TaxID=571913 RepID=A0A0K1JH98_9MICO|nr:MFS transporter [Luteipulveratus mongoliensis]AKU16076.1 hypothetical protein VV02_09740 [Luteipulveratus mongoliensis]
MSVLVPRRIAFPLAAVTMASLLAAAAAPSPLYPVYQQLWGFSSLTLTLIFAVYVFALLAALLTVGSVSDHVGRRPVVIGALLLLAVSMALFIVADGVSGLLVARVVQGLATGAATGTLSAMIVDFQPSQRTGSTVASSAPTLGLAAGAVLAGALVQYAFAPRYLVYWVLLVLDVALAAAVWFLPEATGERRLSWRAVAASLRPSAGVPRPLRSLFFSQVPALASTWALAGLYLSLGPSVVGHELHVDNHLLAGVVLAAMFGSGAVGSASMNALPEAARRPTGYLTLGAGVVLSVIGAFDGSLVVYLVASAIAGFGFGATFQNAMGAIAVATPPAERGQVFATTFVVSYTAFSVPALVAGLAVQEYGLRDTLLGYAVLEIALVVTASGGDRARRRAESGELDEARAQEAG